MKVSIQITDFSRTINFLIYSGNPEALAAGDTFSVARPIQLKFETRTNWDHVQPTLGRFKKIGIQRTGGPK